MAEQHSRRIIVNFLSPDYTQMDLHEVLHMFPGYRKCNLVYDVSTGQNASYGFAEFDTHEDAVKCVHNFEERAKVTGYQHKVGEKEIKFSLARPHSAEYQETRIMVRGIPATWSQMDLRKRFEQCGQIVHANVVPRKPDSPHPTTFGFVTFEEHQSAIKAIDHHSPPFTHGGVRLVVKMAE